MRLTSVVSTWTWHVPLSTGLAVVVVVAFAPLFGWALAHEQWLIAGGLGLAALIPVFIRWPVVSTFGLYAFLTTSFDSLPLLQGVSTLTRPVAVLAAGVLLIAGLMERRLVRPPSAAVWWTLFTVWAFLSIAWAINPQLPINRIPRALGLIVVYLVAVCFRPSRKELYWVCVLTVLGGAVAAGMGYLFGLEGGMQGRGRLTIGDMDSNPNWLGRMVLLPLALATAAAVGLRGAAQRGFAVGCAGLLAVGIYISMSRSALAGMIVVVMMLMYRLRARWQVLAACAVFLALSMTMPDRFYERVGAVVSGEDSTGSGRTEIWKVGLGALDQFWLFGAGLDNYVEVYRAELLGRGLTSHNMYLGMWVELGIIGFMLMVAGLAAQLLALQRRLRTGKGGLVAIALEAAFFGMLVQMLFSDLLWTRTFWLTLTLMAWAAQAHKLPWGQTSMSTARAGVS